jgi:hypothetical protein
MADNGSTTVSGKDPLNLCLRISILVFSVLAMGSAAMPWVCRGDRCSHWMWSFEAYAMGAVPIVGGTLGTIAGIIALVKRGIGRATIVLALIGGIISTSAVPITFAIGRPNWNWGIGMTFCLIGGTCLCVATLWGMVRGGK